MNETRNETNRWPGTRGEGQPELVTRRQVVPRDVVSGQRADRRQRVGRGDGVQADDSRAAHQDFPRAVEQRQDKRPVLSDLRESGSLEQDSDIVMFIDRPDMYAGEGAKTNIADIIVAKHRNGPTATIQLVFRSALTKFENAETRHVDLRQV